MPCRIDVHYGVVAAISVKVKSVYALGICVGYAVYRDESARGKIIIPRLQLVQTDLGIKVVSAVAYGIYVTDVRSFGYLRSVVCTYRMIAPCVVCISYHNITAAVNKRILDYIFKYNFIENRLYYNIITQPVKVY